MNGRIKYIGYWRRLLTDADGLSLMALDLDNGQADWLGSNGSQWSADVPAAIAANVTSLVFDGSTNGLYLATSVNANVAGGAVNVWFKPAAFGGMIVNYGFLSYIRLLDSTHIRVQGNVTGFQDFVVPVLIVGTWYNLHVNRETGGNTRVFLNGVASGSGALAVPGDLSIAQFGRYHDGEFGFFYQGKLADARLYSGALSDADVALLASGSAISTAPFRRWKLNEGTGTQVHDTTTPVGGTAYSRLSAGLKTNLSDWWEFNPLLSDKAGPNPLTNVGGVTSDGVTMVAAPSNTGGIGLRIIGIGL